MAAVLGPIAFTLFVWWFSTGLIIYLGRFSRATYRWSLLGATLLLVGALYALHASSSDDSVAGAYVAFSSAIIIWGWHECCFLMGALTGSRTTSCPPGAKGWRRAAYATQAISHHEAALFATLVLVAMITYGDGNQTGLWTFGVLWLMRLSAKLNLFLGVTNPGTEFLPEHLKYLSSYFARAPMNLLFPVSVTASTIGAVVLWQNALSPDVSVAVVTGTAFEATLLTLAVVEHWFLVAPFEVSALWSWSFRANANDAGKAPADAQHPPDALPRDGFVSNKIARSGRGS